MTTKNENGHETGQNTAHTFTEAPASWTVKYYTLDGFDAMLTIRGQTGQEVLEKAGAALRWLQENQARPFYGTPQTGESNGTGTLADGAPDPAWCPVHEAPMMRREKDGQVWYSHKVDGRWCKGQANGSTN